MKTEYIVNCPERALVQLAQRGDLAAFDELVSSCEETLRSLAYRRLGNLEDAQDAVQETFLRAWSSIRRFDSHRPMLPWLRRICTNLCIDSLRERRIRCCSLDATSFAIADPSCDFESDLAGMIDREDLTRALSKLPKKYATILTMRVSDHMEVHEIANALSAPEGTVKSWLFRARKLLRNELETLSAVPA